MIFESYFGMNYAGELADSTYHGLNLYSLYSNLEIAICTNTSAIDDLF
ncbi:MAG: hypothetical protein ACJAWO_002337 [Halieaceae bacterium]|jgi:hypothetical protein